MLEYHHFAARERVLALVEDEFTLVREKSSVWRSSFEQGSPYREDLDGDAYGILCFAKRNLTRLRRNPAQAFAPPAGLRELLRNLPGALQRSMQSRLKRMRPWFG